MNANLPSLGFFLRSTKKPLEIDELQTLRAKPESPPKPQLSPLPGSLSPLHPLSTMPRRSRARPAPASLGPPEAGKRSLGGSTALERALDEILVGPGSSVRDRSTKYPWVGLEVTNLVDCRPIHGYRLQSSVTKLKKLVHRIHAELWMSEQLERDSRSVFKLGAKVHPSRGCPRRWPILGGSSSTPAPGQPQCRLHPFRHTYSCMLQRAMVLEESLKESKSQTHMGLP